MDMEKENRRVSLIREAAKVFIGRVGFTALWVSLVLGGLVCVLPLIQFHPQGPNFLLGAIFVVGAWLTALLALLGIYGIHPLALRLLSKAETSAQGFRYQSYLSAVLFGSAVMASNVLAAYVIYQHLGLLYLVSYVAGACLTALLIRVSGGVFTAAADIGMALSRVEQPKVPDESLVAGYLNQLGDHVRDLCGFPLDAATSMLVIILAGMLLLSVGPLETLAAETFVLLNGLPWMLPLLGVLATLLGGLLGCLLIARGRHVNLLMNGLYATLLAGAGLVTWFYRAGSFQSLSLGMLPWLPDVLFLPTLCALGLLGGGLIGFGCEWYTSSRFRPVQWVLEWSQRGPALTLLAGMTTGLRSTFVIVAVLLTVYGMAVMLGGYFGFFVAALGLVLPLGMVVAVNAYGALTHYLGDISKRNPQALLRSERVNEMDNLAYTTTAVGKGFLGGVTFFTTLALFLASVFHFNIAGDQMQVLDMRFFVGLVLGALLPYLFTALLLPGVLAAVARVSDETARQLSEIPYLREGKATPDLVKATFYASNAALNALIWPGMLVFFMPIIVGFFGGHASLVGLMAGSLISGFLMAFQYGNTGGALGNVKKYIEKGYFGGPGTSTHAATLVADSVGDALKDAMGPSVNVVVKLLVLISLLAGIFVLGG